MGKKELLEELAELQGCKYISDLKYRRDKGLFGSCRYLLNSKPEKYTIKEWEECIRYLTGEAANVNSLEDVARLMELK